MLVRTCNTANVNIQTTFELNAANQACEYTIAFIKNKAHLCISNHEKAFISSTKHAFVGNALFRPRKVTTSFEYNSFSESVKKRKHRSSEKKDKVYFFFFVI